MFASGVRYLRRRRALSIVRMALTKNDDRDLAGLSDTDDELIPLVVQAAEATRMLRNKDRRISQAAFSALYATVRYAPDPGCTFLKIYSLYYLAMLRGAHSDCFFHATNAHKMKGIAELRKALCMPLPTERNMLGSFVTATR